MPRLEQFRLPDVGEGLTEGEILQWFVQPGDVVTVNQSIVEIETAKAAVELPCPYAGVVRELHAAAGDTVPVGQPIVTIDTLPDEPADQPSPEQVPTPEEIPAGEWVPAGARPGSPAEPAVATGAEGSTPTREPVLVGYGVLDDTSSGGPRRRARRGGGDEAMVAGSGPAKPVAPTRIGGLEVGRAVERALAGAQQVTAGAGRVLAKPPVRRLARQLGVELADVPGSGPGGAVTRADVEAFAGRTASGSPASGGVLAPTAMPVEARAGATELDLRRARREPVRGVTRYMAEAMVRSAFTIPHVTEWVDVDVTRSVKLVQRLRETPGYADVRVSPLLLVARAALAGLRRTPLLNASFDADAGEHGEIVHPGAVNLGIAAATPRGLVVPNIKGADRLSLPELAVALDDLVNRAKEGRTAPANLVGGTFTLTNIGVFGVDGGTPIINPGEGAILAVGAFRQRPWVHRGKVRARWVAELTVSFDHRFIDGATGSRFLADVAAVMEDPALAATW